MTTEDFKGKKLYRSRSNRMLAGVCGGVAEFFETDPTLVRIAWVALTLFGGIGIILYLAALIIVPNNPSQEAKEGEDKLIKDKSLFWGSLLIIFGVFLLLKQTGIFYNWQFWHVPWELFWGIVLIGLGAYLLFVKKKKEEGEEEAEQFSFNKLYKSRSQKMLAGIAGGMSEYFDYDVSLIRILWVVFAVISGGIGILIYIIMAIVLPEKSPESNEPEIKS